MLFYLDSNQDKQDQNLLCYHYTIEQSLQNCQVNFKCCSTWIEPGQTGPESVVLPLHHRTIFNKSPTLLLADAKVYTFSKFANKLSKKMSRKKTYVFF